MYSPKGIAESQEDYLDAIDNGSLYEAYLSDCYRVSALWKEDNRYVW